MSERFTPTNFQLGGSFVQDLSGFQQATAQIGAFFGEKAAQKAAAEGATPEFDVEGKPVLPEQRGTFRRSSRAFNESSIKAYQASVQSDVLENVSRIKAENADNPEAFQKAFDGFSIGILGEIADPIKPNIIQLLDNLGTRARISVQDNFLTKTNAENKALLDQAQTGFKNESLSALFNGDLVTSAAARNSFVESLDNPLISAAEAADKIKAFDDEADETQLLGSLDRLYDEDPRKALVALSEFQKADPEDFDFTPQRQAELINKGYASVLNRTKLAEQIETVGDEETKRGQDAFEADLTAKAFSGDLSQAEFLDAVNKRLISPSAADRIQKRMNNVFAVKDNPTFIVEFERDLPDLPTAEAEMRLDTAIADGSITSSTAGRLQRALNQRDATEEDEQVKINRDLLKGLVKPLTGPAAVFLDPTAEGRRAFAVAEFNRRVAEGEDSNVVFTEVFESFNRGNEIILKSLPSLRFGSLDDLGAAEAETLKALDRREISEADAEKQLGLIQTMERLKVGARKP